MIGNGGPLTVGYEKEHHVLLQFCHFLTRESSVVILLT